MPLLERDPWQYRRRDPPRLNRFKVFDHPSSASWHADRRMVLLSRRQVESVQRSGSMSLHFIRNGDETP